MLQTGVAEGNKPQTLIFSWDMVKNTQAAREIFSVNCGKSKGHKFDFASLVGELPYCFFE